MREFELIDKYFSRLSTGGRGVSLGIGDDAAILNVPDTHQLVVTTDTLAAGTHFFHHDNPADVAWKAVAVNVSDLAAMGARPLWLTLSITLPDAEEAWLSRFAQGLKEALTFYDLALVGGDTVKGPLSICVTAFGQVPRGQALTRSSAKPGDWIFCTGTLGDAAAGLALLTKKLRADKSSRDYLLGRFRRPAARVAAGIALRHIASACIDISDGLIADLGHILKNSGDLGARIDLDALPTSKALENLCSDVDLWEFALAGGEDYELCFTVPEDAHDRVAGVLQASGVQAVPIGRVTTSGDIEFLHVGQPVRLALSPWEHFET